MDLANASEFLYNKTILITGATGFLAKILVEKILRVQPNVNKLYLLIRASDTKSSLDRLHHEIISKDVFRVLREMKSAEFESFISEKVAPIAGDVSLPDLGLANNNNVWKEIDALIHVAAATKFYERYDLALEINTLGSRNVMAFAKKCSNLQILVHVSTAYVCGEEKGLIEEKPCKIGKTLNGKFELDIDAERRLIAKTRNDLTREGASPKKIRDVMRTLGKQRAKLHGWPNTYVFTKAMGEMLIGELRKDVPVVIIRPTMVSSTYKEPFPGWIEGFGSVGTVSTVMGKGFVHFTYANRNSVFDLIPADMVVNAIVMAMVANAKKPCLTVYQVGSSLRNPLTFRELVDINYQYFTKKPWIDDHRRIVKCSRLIVNYKVIFLMLLAMRLLKLMVLKLVGIASVHYLKLNLDKLEKQIKATVMVAEIFKPYLFFTGIFEDNNCEKLRTALRENGIDEEGRFCFDPKCIEWEDYLLNAHIPATVKYLF